MQKYPPDQDGSATESAVQLRQHPGYDLVAPRLQHFGQPVYGNGGWTLHSYTNIIFCYQTFDDLDLENSAHFSDGSTDRYRRLVFQNRDSRSCGPRQDKMYAYGFGALVYERH